MKRCGRARSRATASVKNRPAYRVESCSNYRVAVRKRSSLADKRVEKIDRTFGFKPINAARSISNILRFRFPSTAPFLFNWRTYERLSWRRGRISSGSTLTARKDSADDAKRGGLLSCQGTWSTSDVSTFRAVRPEELIEIVRISVIKKYHGTLDRGRKKEWTCLWWGGSGAW